MRLGAIIGGGAIIAGILAAFAAGPFMANASAASGKKMIAAGKLKLGGRTIACGRTPTQLSPTFWDYGGATKGRIILNPVKLAELPESVRLWVYAHECGHQIYGARETRADCYAVQRGRREGWLDQTGMDDICAFLKDRPGDWVHPPGWKRCKAMVQCFGKVKSPRASR
jgi:hypothetical protein